MSDINFLKSENQKLRQYISLLQAQIELSQRVVEIKQNFANSPESERFIMPILDRIERIKSEKKLLEKELNFV